MTLTTQTPKEIKTGNGSTTVWSFTFVINQSSDLVVVKTVTATDAETTLTEGTGTTNYSVSVGTYPGNGSITYPATLGTELPSTETITLKRVVDIDQDTDLVNQGAWSPSTVENAFDYSRMIDLQQDEDIDRSLKVPVSVDTSAVSTTLPAPVGGSYIRWNAGGTAMENTTTTAGQHLIADGTVSLPGYSFTSDSNTGFYRIGSGNVAYSADGSKVVDYSTSGVSITGTLTSSGILSVDDTTESTSGTTGSIHTDGGLGVAKKLHVVGVATHGDDIVSDTDSTDDLGTTGVRWANLWVDDITMTNDLDVGNDLTVAGNLTVNGTTVTNDATNTVIKDPLIGLNEGAASNANDLGIVMERGSTGDNVFMGWDESGDYFAFGTTTDLSSSTGNITYSLGQARFEGLNLSGTSADLGTVTTVDVDGGTIDGTAIGGAATAAGAFTTVDGTLAHFTTSLQLATGATVTGILDEDAMGSDSATELATQQSIKAYSDSNALAPGMPMTWESDTDSADKGDGRIWLNHVTPSSATLQY